MFCGLVVWLFIDIILLQAGNRISELIIPSTRITTRGPKFSIITWSIIIIFRIAFFFIYSVSLVLF
jgi:hypothetical protein